MPDETVPVDHRKYETGTVLRILKDLSYDDLDDKLLDDVLDIFDEQPRERFEFEEKVADTRQRLATAYRAEGWDGLVQEIEALAGLDAIEQWYWFKLYHYPVSQIMACMGIPEWEDRMKHEMLVWYMDQFECMVVKDPYRHHRDRRPDDVGGIRTRIYIDVLNKLLVHCGRTLSPNLRNFLDKGIGIPQEDENEYTKEYRRNQLLEFCSAIRKELSLPDYGGQVCLREHIEQRGEAGTSSQKSCEATVQSSSDWIQLKYVQISSDFKNWSKGVGNHRLPPQASTSLEYLHNTKASSLETGKTMEEIAAHVQRICRSGAERKWKIRGNAFNTLALKELYDQCICFDSENPKGANKYWLLYPHSDAGKPHGQSTRQNASVK